MTNEWPLDPTRVEFRIVCRDRNGTDLTWKITDSLDDAIRFIDELEPRFRKHGEWLVYEVTIAESARIVHRLKQPPDS